MDLVTDLGACVGERKVLLVEVLESVAVLTSSPGSAAQDSSLTDLQDRGVGLLIDVASVESESIDGNAQLQGKIE